MQKQKCRGYTFNIQKCSKILIWFTIIYVRVHVVGYTCTLFFVNSCRIDPHGGFEKPVQNSQLQQTGQFQNVKYLIESNFIWQFCTVFDVHTRGKNFWCSYSTPCILLRIRSGFFQYAKTKKKTANVWSWKLSKKNAPTANLSTRIKIWQVG